MKMIKEKSCLYSALCTFIEAFISVLVVMIPTINWSEPKEMLKMTLLGILGSSLSAGVAAVMAKKEETV